MTDRQLSDEAPSWLHGAHVDILLMLRLAGVGADGSGFWPSPGSEERKSRNPPIPQRIRGHGYVFDHARLVELTALWGTGLM